MSFSLHKLLIIQDLKEFKILNSYIEEEIVKIESKKKLNSYVKSLINTKNRLIGLKAIASRKKLKYKKDIEFYLSNIHLVDNLILKAIAREVNRRGNGEKNKSKATKKSKKGKVLVGENFKPPNMSLWKERKANANKKKKINKEELDPKSVHKIIYVGRMYY